MSDEFRDQPDTATEDPPDVVLDDEQIDDLPIDADPADVVDQRREVTLDDELLDGDVIVDDGDGLADYEP
jgi:hypothetical protein